MVIDDVPVMALTISAKPSINLQSLNYEDLTLIARILETELKTNPGTRNVYTLGEYGSVLTINLDKPNMLHAGAFLHSVDDLKISLSHCKLD
jgi:multidrug efflux pump subunit AcrB